MRFARRPVVARLKRRTKIALLVAYVLVVQEIAMRVLFPVPEVLNFDRIEYAPRTLGGRSEGRTSLSNASFRWTSDPDGVEALHELNLYGFRDRDWSLEPAGERGSSAISPTPS
ncbi:MAG: hypothetical protein AAF488_15475 [Planctomycetota bacterium]